MHYCPIGCFLTRCAFEASCTVDTWLPALRRRILGSRQPHWHRGVHFFTRLEELPGRPAATSSFVEATKSTVPLTRVGASPVASRGAETVGLWSSSYGRLQCGAHASRFAVGLSKTSSGLAAGRGRQVCRACCIIHRVIRVAGAMNCLTEAACFPECSLSLASSFLAALCADHGNKGVR